MNYCNLTTGEIANVLPVNIGDAKNIHYPDGWPLAHTAGWRIITDTPTPDGQRIAGYAQADDPDYADPVFEAIPPTPEPTPERFAHGIDTSLLVLDTADGNGIGYVATATGELEPIVFAHESPYDMAALKLKIIAARDAGDSRRARLLAIKLDLDQVSEALDGLDVSNSGPMGQAIGNTTGNNKAALQAVQSVLQDVKTIAKNLRQATNKIRRDIR